MIYVQQMQFTNSGTIYAAKIFYNIGESQADAAVTTVSAEDNLRHLKEELLHQLAIKAAVEAFNKAAEESKIAIYGKMCFKTQFLLVGLTYHGADLQFADSFIIKVKDGMHDGKAWLIDPLLDSTRMRKFLGTNQAGANTDFAGKTCDAFAHFALIDSGLEFVPTDMQGKSMA